MDSPYKFQNNTTAEHMFVYFFILVFLLVCFAGINAPLVNLPVPRSRVIVSYPRLVLLVLLFGKLPGAV
uniref:Uncharacterized protein n=1 Tax=Ixodes ricinus TaxID=34613 RepID=A0A6B0TR58_IXORI